MNQRVMLLVRSVAGVVVLIVLVSVVFRWWGQYLEMAREASSATATGSPAQRAAEAGAASQSEEDEKPVSAPDETPQQPAEEPADTGEPQGTLEITTQGLNLRTEPDRGSASVRGLNRGEVVTLLAEQNGWYQVRDAQGAVGWISSNSSYSKRR